MSTEMTIMIVALGVILVLFWLHSFFILYHLIRFGIGTRPKQAALIFFVGSLMLFFMLSIAAIGIVLEVPSLTDITSKIYEN